MRLASIDKCIVFHVNASDQSTNHILYHNIQKTFNKARWRI